MKNLDVRIENTESKMEFIQATFDGGRIVQATLDGGRTLKTQKDSEYFSELQVLNQKEMERSQELIQELRSTKAEYDTEFQSNGLQLHLTEWTHRDILNLHFRFRV